MASVARSAPAGAADTASHPYTCNTCQVAYRNIDLQKGHMKSDWHRYNLKRRVASLPPISAETFTEKVLQARAVSTAEADKAYFERACQICDKTYYSANAYQNHLLSQKHKVNESQSSQRPEDDSTSVISSTFSLGEPMAAPKSSVDSDVEEEFNQVIRGIHSSTISEQRPSPVKRPSNPKPGSHVEERTDISDDEVSDRSSNATKTAQSTAESSWDSSTCIFCNYKSPTAPLNASHMERFHGMFIPEKAYLVDLDGLMAHLHTVVREQHQCLACGKMRSSVFAIQTHMRDKGHCRIPFSTEEEQLNVGEFYDFRSTYSDDESDAEDSSEETGDNGGAKLGVRRPVKFTTPEGDELDEEEVDGWETDSSESSLDSEDLTAVPAEGHIHQFEKLDKHSHHSNHDPRNRHQLDGWHSHAHKHNRAVFYDEYELHLPSGKSVGHRSLNKYYRQNLNNYPSEEERAERQAIEAPGRERSPAARGRQVVPRGEAGLTGISEQKKLSVQMAEKRGRNLQSFNTKKTDWAYSKKLNNHKNYYYREQGGG